MKFSLSLLALVTYLFLPAQHSETINHKNNISINPLTPFTGNIQITYERAITRNMTLDLEFGAKISGGLIKISGLDSPTIQTNDFEFTGFILTPSYRWYVQKTDKSHTGFYVGAYYRYRNIKDEVIGNYHSSSTATDSPIDVEVDIVASTVGIQFGYKLPIGNHFNIDFLIGGPGYNFGTIKVQENKPLPSGFYDDLDSVIPDDFGFLESYVSELDFKDTGDLSAETNFHLPAWRYSIKVGYSF